MTRYLDVSEMSYYDGEEERIYFGDSNFLLIVDIESQLNNKEYGEYKSVRFREYLNPFNWFVKVSNGYCYPTAAAKIDKTNNYNLSGLNFNERVILNRMLCNYLKIKKWDIPKYIEILFEHYCINKKGNKCHPYGDEWYIKPLSYISFNSINSDVSLFNAFRSHFFYSLYSLQINPNKLIKVFPNCTLFYDQEFNKWELKNNVYGIEHALVGWDIVDNRWSDVM